MNYHKCKTAGCETQLSEGAPELCPKCQEAADNARITLQTLSSEAAKQASDYLRREYHAGFSYSENEAAAIIARVFAPMEAQRDQLDAELTLAKADLIRLTSDRDRLAALLDRAGYQIEENRLEKELAALRADKERLDWLDSYDSDCWWNDFSAFPGPRGKLRATIDAAKKEDAT